MLHDQFCRCRDCKPPLPPLPIAGITDEAASTSRVAVACYGLILAFALFVVTRVAGALA